MNFLELINMTLEELCYKQVSAFSELVKPDHKKLMTIVNRVNNILLDAYDWEFLLRELEFDVEPNEQRVKIPADLKIKHVYVDGRELYYTERCERYLAGAGYENCYSTFDCSLLLTPVNKTRKLKVVYVTKNHAKTAQGEEIPRLVDGSDETLLPDEYAQSALVYGACVQFKSNPQHPKYKHWLNGFTEARAKMRATSEHVTQRPPEIKLPRWTLGYDRYHNLI